MRYPLALPPRHKGMLLALVSLLSLIYLWVSSEDSLANTFAAGSGRLGFAGGAPPRTLVLFPDTMLGAQVAAGLARAGHVVFALRDESAAKDPEIAVQEIVPLHAEGTWRNVSALVELVQRNGIQHVVDTRPLRETEGDAGLHMLAFARRLTQPALTASQGSGIKRTYIYTSGCALHTLSTEAAAAHEWAPPSTTPLPAGQKSVDHHDFPPHNPMAAPAFEEGLLWLGKGRSSKINTVVLRPGVLYGGAAWATSPLRHWLTAAGGVDAPLAESAQAGASPLLRPFAGVHLDDVVAAYVSLSSATPASLQELSGQAFDLRDETRVSNAVAAVALRKMAATGATKVIGTRDPAHFAHPETEVLGKEEQKQVNAAAAKAPGAARRLLSRVTTLFAASAAVDPWRPLSSAPSRCMVASKDAMVKFSTVTRWKPAHRRFNEPDRLATYVSAIQALEAKAQAKGKN